jgi:ABC-type uncharacterized transport system fused permease/ATPase subunit
MFLKPSSGSLGYLIAKERWRHAERKKAELVLRQLEAQVDAQLKKDTVSVSPDASADSAASMLVHNNATVADASTAAIVDAASAQRKARAANAGSFSSLLRLMRLCMPSIHSRPALLFGVQFFLLMCRALLSVKATRATVYFLSSAIARASWPHWTNWLSSFFFWMSGGIAINSGLHFVETLIALSIREALTKHIHTHYLANNAFYKALQAKSVRMDNLDQRITKDVANFSWKVAFLYGHSFKPILDFLLSLREASIDIGWTRPLALFMCSSIVSTVLRSLVPSLGKQVAREAELDGNFAHAHSRLIAHAEEIAFLDGGKTERTILDESLGTLLAAKSLHNLQRLTKHAVDNFLKFFGLMLGGPFGFACFAHACLSLRSQLLLNTLH